MHGMRKYYPRDSASRRRCWFFSSRSEKYKPAAEKAMPKMPSTTRSRPGSARKRSAIERPRSGLGPLASPRRQLRPAEEAPDGEAPPAIVADTAMASAAAPGRSRSALHVGPRNVPERAVRPAGGPAIFWGRGVGGVVPITYGERAAWRRRSTRRGGAT